MWSTSVVFRFFAWRVQRACVSFTFQIYGCVFALRSLVEFYCPGSFIVGVGVPEHRDWRFTRSWATPMRCLGHVVKV